MEKKLIKLEGPVPAEVVGTITMIAKQMAPKYLFPGRDIDDMVQEGILICLEALPQWDRERPLENFMRVRLRTRYLNYIRNNYCRYEKTTDPDKAARLAEHNKNRQNLMSPVSVEDVSHTIVSESRAHEDVAYGELVKFIKDRLPIKLRSDYLRMIDSVHISAARKDAVRAAVTEILKEYHDAG